MEARSSKLEHLWQFMKRWVNRKAHWDTWEEAYAAALDALEVERSLTRLVEAGYEVDISLPNFSLGAPRYVVTLMRGQEVVRGERAPTLLQALRQALAYVELTTFELHYVSCQPCEVERHGCACGPHGYGCFACRPGEFKRPPCAPGCEGRRAKAVERCPTCEHATHGRELCARRLGEGRFCSCHGEDVTPRASCMGCLHPFHGSGSCRWAPIGIVCTCRGEAGVPACPLCDDPHDGPHGVCRACGCVARYFPNERIWRGPTSKVFQVLDDWGLR